MCVCVCVLELADWKNYRGYRLLAVDHGFFSFTDLRFGEWPAILITFPKAVLSFNRNAWVFYPRIHYSGEDDWDVLRV